MRRLLAGLLAVLAAVLVGGAATVLAVWAFGAILFSGPLTRLFEGTPWKEPAIIAGVLFIVSLIVSSALIGAWVGERTLAWRGFPLPRRDGGPLPLRKRVAAGIAGYAVGLGWTVLTAMLIAVPYLEPLALLLAAAGPCMGVAAMRFVERGPRRPRGGAGGGGAAPGGSAAPSGPAAAGDGVPSAPPQPAASPPPSSFGGCFTITSAATASTAARTAPST